MKKSVSFLPDSSVVEIPSVSVLSRIEITKCWLQRSDRESIVSDLRIAKVNIAKNTIADTQYFTIRGLEHWISEEGNRRKEAKRCAIRAVLDEQRAQKKQSIDDPELLAERSRTRTNDSAKRAYEIGLEDAEEAKRLAHSEHPDWISSQLIPCTFGTIGVPSDPPCALVVSPGSRKNGAFFGHKQGADRPAFSSNGLMNILTGSFPSPKCPA